MPRVGGIQQGFSEFITTIKRTNKQNAYPSGRKNWRIKKTGKFWYQTRHVKVLSVHDLLLHHETAERDNAAGTMAK